MSPASRTAYVMDAPVARPVIARFTAQVGLAWTAQAVTSSRIDPNKPGRPARIYQENHRTVAIKANKKRPRT
ncbi:hypothetical protein CHELA20_51402 [Hyphomicrobiales bacterium]|nr:hypothetical protein CHELA41_23612 [Hyphomicrobiales bacterium]CAH1675804.1 hypothetical protein CHELA20_51402 [Hyphomicrobiales bacterium]